MTATSGEPERRCIRAEDAVRLPPEFANRALAPARSLRAALVRLARDEEGGALVFGTLTMLALVAFTFMVVNTGLVSATRLSMQDAADSAAYSGALVEANSFNSIAQINDGMAYIYYNLARYSIDVIVYGTLTEMEEHEGGATGGFGMSDDGGESPEPSHDVVWGPGSSDPSAREVFDEVRQRAEEKMPLGMEWLERLSETETIIARATPALVRREVFRVARANGAERVSILPGGPLLDDEGPLEDDPSGASGELPDRFARRYERLDTGFDQDGATEYPEWYAPAIGGTRRQRTDAPYDPEVYYQTRICWNSRDLEHEEPNPHMEDPYYEFPIGAPNGHWHEEHSHYIFDEMSGTVIELPPHELGHIDEPGHEDIIDYPPAEPLHHYSVRCPTCDATDHDRDLYTDVRKFQEDIEADEDLQFIDLSRLAPPLVLTVNAAEERIAVGCWRRAGGTFMTSVFRNPPWGYVTVAVAEVRPIDRDGRFYDDQRVLDLAQGDPDGDGRENLYLTADLRFDARLVPARSRIRGQDAQGWWSDLLYRDEAWKSSPDDDAGDSEVADLLREMDGPDGEGRFMTSGNDFEQAIRH